MANELSEEDCTYFDSYVQKWQQRLNLSDWRIERSARRSKANMCDLKFDEDARLVTYRIGISFGSTPVTPESLESTALHECLHILLHDLLEAFSYAREHAVIN